MTDAPRPQIDVPAEARTSLHTRHTAAPKNPAGNRAKRRHPAARTRIAAAGMGLAAMAALVSRMEVADGRAQAATTGSASGSAYQGAGVIKRTSAAWGSSQAVAAAKASKPIVLTPHAVVHKVNAPPTGGGGGYVSSGYAAAPAAAPAPAPAAPVASTGGSHP